MKVRTIASAVLLLATFMALLVAVWGSKPAEAAFPGTAGDIVFTEQDAAHPEYNDIFRMGADGYRPSVLATNGTAPSWSADGNKIAFASERSGNWDIYRMAADGTGQTNLTNDPTTDPHYDFGPSWFPNNKIAFVSDRGGASTFANFDLYVLNLNSSGNPVGDPVRLTTNPALDADPAVSPNGKKIAFRSHRDGDDEIYVMNANAPESRTNKPVQLTHNTTTDMAPDWSPDGKHIVFDRYTEGTNGVFNHEVWVMNSDGTHQTNLTSNANTDTSPAYSPDGKKIAFASNRSGQFDIWRMRADGTNPVDLTAYSHGAEGSPDWQPIP